VLVVALVLLLGSGVGGFLLLRSAELPADGHGARVSDGGPPRATGRAAPPATRAVERKATWLTLHMLDSQPSGARVLDERGRELGRTPFETSARDDPGALARYTLVRPGMARVVVELPRDGKEHRRKVRLRPLPGAARGASSASAPAGATAPATPADGSAPGHATAPTPGAAGGAAAGGSHGALAVACSPATATLRVRGPGLNYQGRCPLTRGGLQPGAYALAVEAPGHAPYRGTVTVQAQREARQQVNLRAATGWLTVTTARPGAQVYVDGRVVGRAPLVDLPVPAGYHHVMASWPGQHPQARQVMVPAGRRVQVGL